MCSGTHVRVATPGEQVIEFWEEVQDYFYAKPVRVIVAGRWLASFGGAALIAGLIGHVATVGASVLQSQRGAGTSPKLESVYPGYWLWWVPESAVGGFPYLVMVAAGAWLVSRGRFIQRVYG